DAAANLRPRPPPDPQAEGDVVVDGHVLERRVVLEDEADPAALGRVPGHVLLGDQDLALVGPLEPGDHAQEGRLAAAARAEERGQRARRHLERHAVERDEVPEALRDPARHDAHLVSSLGRNRFIATSVAIAIAASSTDAAYAPVRSNDSNESCTKSVAVSFLPARCPDTTLTAPNSPRQRAVVSTTPYATAQRIAGSVMRRKVAKPDAPRVAAACSCSVPISRSTGTTSRTTNGSETKIVASTIPGSEKITWMPASASAPPSQPLTP